MPRTTFYGFKNVPVTIQPNIGLETSARQSVIEILNLLMADEAVLLLKTGQAGTVDGPVLQPVYDAQSKQISALSNEIVERIQILGGSQLKDPEVLINTARLDGEPNALPGVVNILADHEAFIRFLREDARKCSEIYEDLGTFALLVGVMRSHEKMAWILRSNIASNQFDAEK